ncbi:MAG: glycosyltransferase family 2 protein [Paracoccaceae bacterium]
MRLFVSTMKKEGAFALEWAAHRLAIGFDRFLAHTNDCEGESDMIPERLAELGHAAHERNVEIRARRVQTTALMRADAHPLRAQSEWFARLDIDEFVNVKLDDGRLLMNSVRGSPNSPLATLDLGYRAERNYCQVGDRSIERSASPRAEWLTRLTVPVLSDLREAAVIWRRARIRVFPGEAGPLKLWLRLNPLIARSWTLERAAHRG